MEIQFSKECFDDLNEIEDYLLNNQVLENFNLKLDNCLKMITEGIVVFNIMNKLIVHRILQNFQDPEENYKTLL